VSRTLQLARVKARPFVFTSPGLSRHQNHFLGRAQNVSAFLFHPVSECGPIIALQEIGDGWSAAIDRWHAAMMFLPPASGFGFRRFARSPPQQSSRTILFSLSRKFPTLGEHHGCQRLSQLALSGQLAEIERMDMINIIRALPPPARMRFVCIPYGMTARIMPKNPPSSAAFIAIPFGSTIRLDAKGSNSPILRHHVYRADHFHTSCTILWNQSYDIWKMPASMPTSM